MKLLKRTLALTLSAAMVLGLLSGCGSDVSANVLNVYNWGEYIDTDLLDRFEQETGIKVIYNTFDSNENLYSRIQTTSYDVIIPSDYAISRFIDEDMLQPLNYDHIPNMKLIDEKYTHLDFDPEQKYSVPYTWGVVGIVYNKTMVMEKLVRNMSDFSEYELGRMQYHFEYVDMLPFLQDLAEEYQDDVQQSGMTFQAALPKGSYTVTADRGKLKRVLDNLVSNAVKYGKPGGEIHFSAEEYEGGLVLQVTDNGKGISPQALHHVFDSFFRADAARTSSVPGSGLGLAICRSIVDSHHGKIWLTSEEGEGTRAFVYLPLQKEEGMP